ncbi:flavodoxin family protein [Sphaerimonospora thailandensis]|uniref:TrpR-binding protein WrbA n=1 Tax=Sphaerimonospora thailandensis TaxID=795644 RepID=A0A8J3VWN1_9ACTN|nr:NAD(P)H-dependent oxidoreductase [Sphaerimonospora thailandensis]GIH67984.1 TrpR-binding protein WrbA [Sphaerimonospora thailandensis]
MTNVAVIYYSTTGNVHRLAGAAAAAAEKVGASVRLRRIPVPGEEVHVPGTEDAAAAHRLTTGHIEEVALEDLEWADGILIGTPVRFGLPAAAVARFIDTTAGLSIPGKLRNKAVSAFTSGSAPHGGQETAILALHNAFCHWGSLIVPNGSTDPVLFRPGNGNPYGSANVSRNRPGNVHEDNVAAVGYQARRLTEIAGVLPALAPA